MTPNNSQWLNEKVDVLAFRKSILSKQGAYVPSIDGSGFMGRRAPRRPATVCSNRVHLCQGLGFRILNSFSLAW